jgi:hypothetical protein
VEYSMPGSALLWPTRISHVSFPNKNIYLTVAVSLTTYGGKKHYMAVMNYYDVFKLPPADGTTDVLPTVCSFHSLTLDGSSTTLCPSLRYLEPVVSHLFTLDRPPTYSKLWINIEGFCWPVDDNDIHAENN